MFYYLSKILYALVSPVNIVLIVWCIYFLTGIKKWLYWAVGLFLFFTNPFLSQNIMSWWEVKPITIEKNEHYDGMIVLCGFTSTMELPSGEIRTIFSDGNDRTMQALDLFHRHVSNRIIYTGGSDTIFAGFEPEADVARKFLREANIPDSCIWTENKAINTYENAYFTKKLLEKKDPHWQQKKYLLITSAFHMRRALACYRKQGINVVPYVADIRSVRGLTSFLNTVIPTYGGFELWTFMLKEWIGVVVYKIKGYW